MNIISSGPTMFSRLFTMLSLKEIIYHGIILRTSSARHTLAETHKCTQDHVNSSVNTKESTGKKTDLKKQLNFVY